MTRTSAGSGLAELEERVVGCRACPRLVEWRELVAREKVARFGEQDYWGKPVPGFGDPQARVLLLGLAPAAHGANRTGRMFTGDRSGDFLYAALHRTGFANQPTSTDPSDGLKLEDAWITSVNRCAPPANKPTPEERDNCLPWFEQELALLVNVRVIVCLGSFAWDGALSGLGAMGHAVPRPKVRFGHAAEATVGPYALLGCFHPSQQNTFTGKLTAQMLDGLLERSREVAG